MRVGSAFYTCTSNRTTGSALREMRVGSAFYTCTSGWKCILYLHFQQSHSKSTSRNEGRKCILYLHFLLGSAFYTCTSIWKCKEVQRSAFSTQPIWIYVIFFHLFQIYIFENTYPTKANCYLCVLFSLFWCSMKILTNCIIFRHSVMN